MHSETNTPAKEMVELDVPLTERKSFLEEDLALSSSTNGQYDDSIAEKTITETEEKSPDEKSPDEKSADETTRQSLSPITTEQPPVIYVSEDAMDCNYDDVSTTTTTSQCQLPTACTTSGLQPFVELQQSSQPVVPVNVVEDEDPGSPELFESDDADDEAESTNTTSTFPATLEEPQRVSLPSPLKLSPAELIFRADKFLLRRINRYLSGVPPPPSHTISQRDCDDFLVYIKQNRQYFWADPFELDKQSEPEAASTSLQESNQEKKEDENTNTTNKVFYQTKAGLRNLSTAFDACEQSSSLKVDNNDTLAVDVEFSDTTSSFSLSETLFNNCSFLSTSSFTPHEESKVSDYNDKETLPTLYNSIKIEDVATLSWPDVYTHRCPEIYYNRNKATEDFENLRMKLCDRYVGAETQSTCNIWFAKQIPGSARKRSLLGKRNNGQSPGKRLSYLARRRRTFSSANLQGLGVAEKKIMLNVNKGKLLRKGKSPRGKTPRKGKSPRGKTPRSSAKKRHIRRLLLEGPSPRKTKIETSKRALFQSPPTDRPGPSRVTATTTTVTNNNPQKIKRALFSQFPTPKKNEASDSSVTQTLSFPESRKRKSEEELESSKQKWAKSLSFDCTRTLENSSSNTWNTVRHSTGSSLSKDGTPNYGRGELSDTHRKKLLWAVAEALRSKGIGMSHPLFKQYAGTLARTVRKFMPDLDNKNVPRKPGSTSDRMLKLAKRHVLLIVEAKTAV